MPPLDNNDIRIHFFQFKGRVQPVKGVGCVDEVLCFFYAKAFVAVVLLLLFKEEFRVLQLVGNHGYLMSRF